VSFRARLTIFFVVIVRVPMVANGVLMFRLIDESQHGKADARAVALASVAGSVYQSAAATGRADADTLAHDVGSLSGKAPAVPFATLAMRAGLARAMLSAGSTTLADVGNQTAIAPVAAILRRGASGRTMKVTVSELTASQYARDLSASGIAVVVRHRNGTLASTAALPNRHPSPADGDVTVHGNAYRVAQTFAGFGAAPARVTVLSALSATSASLGGSRTVAVVLMVAFLALAFGFSILASRALQGRLSGFLVAARRLGSSDFSSPIRVEGHDEFASLAIEFNSMSAELSHGLDELSRERVRRREAIRRIGQTFVSSLDRPALLELALKIAVDAVQASGGRLTVRASNDVPLAETTREGSLSASTMSCATRSALR
jgi:hypothetical protein